MPWGGDDHDVPGHPVIDRATPTDRAFLAMDDQRAPAHFGVILLFDEVDGFDLAHARQVLAERVAAVPRLRQRLVRTPFGCGGPIWVDDEDFDVENQVRVVRCAEPGDERALIDTAYALGATPLPRNGPRWSAVFVTGLADGAVALVVVLHHVLAGGVGGLADPGLDTLPAFIQCGLWSDPVTFPAEQCGENRGTRAVGPLGVRALPPFWTRGTGSTIEGPDVCHQEEER